MYRIFRIVVVDLFIYVFIPGICTGTSYECTRGRGGELAVKGRRVETPGTINTTVFIVLHSE